MALWPPKTDPRCSAVSLRQLSYLFSLCRRRITATSIFLQLTALLTCLFLRHFVICDVSVKTLPRCIVCNTVLAIVKPSVRQSACPSKRKKVLLTFVYHMKGQFIYSFLARRMVAGRRPILPEILGETDPLPASKNGYFQSIFTLNASALTPSEKKFNYR